MKYGKLFKKFNNLYGWFPQTGNKCSELSYSELKRMAVELRYDDNYENIPNYLFRYNSQPKNELALNVYKALKSI